MTARSGDHITSGTHAWRAALHAQRFPRKAPGAGGGWATICACNSVLSVVGRVLLVRTLYFSFYRGDDQMSTG